MQPSPHGVWVIVVAGGSGQRFGSAKQFAELDGRSVIERAVAGARPHAEGIVAVVPDTASRAVDGADVVVAGGASRAGSVRAGLAAVPDDAEVVLVHDAARPLAPARVFDAVIAAVRDGAAAATPAVEVTDTIRRTNGGTVDRAELLSVQTPQGFRAAVLRAAHDGDAEATDDVTLVEQAGHEVVVVAGDRWNLKITEPEDMVVVEALLTARGLTANGLAAKAGAS